MKITPDKAKMEAVGRLAGGAAHDLNNMLGAIEGYATLILNSIKPEDPLRPDLEEIRKAVARASSLTKKFFTFSLRLQAQNKTCSLNAAAEKLLEGRPGLEARGVKLELLPAPGLPACQGDQAQADFVLAALLSNAADAMPEGGTVTVSTRLVPGDPPLCAVSVKDSGQGMPPEVMEHIFEPFFTTKEKGKGAGLSLAMVYGISRQNNGRIEAQSEPGKGAEFTLFLPKAPKT